MAINNTYSNVMVDLKNRSNVMADRKNRSKYEMEDVYENINTEIASTKSPDDSVPKSSTVSPEQHSRRSCVKSFKITWWRIIIAILLFAVVQSLVIVFVLKSDLSKDIFTVSSTTHSTENTNIKECGSPPSVEHSRHFMTGNNTGTLVMYACNEGYYLKGIPAVFCQSDGNWSNIQFSCIRDNESEKIKDEIKKLNSTLKLYKKRQGQLHALGFQDFEFDKSTLSNYRYLSNDRRTISNYKMTKNMERGNGSRQMYSGVIGTRPFTKHDTIYYEVSVYYNISQTIPGAIFDTFAFELGFSTFNTIDNHFYKKLGSIRCLYSPTKNAVVVTVRDNKRKSHSFKPLSPIINNSFFGTFSVYVNGPEMEINCYQRRGDDLEILYTFTGIDFEKPLYPTFIVQSKFTANISLNLKTRKFIKTIPKQLYESV